MTTLKRKLLATSMAAAGLLLSGGVAQAADLDVSSIYGRGSPPSAHSTANYTGPDSAGTEYRSAEVASTLSEPTYPAHASLPAVAYAEDGSRPVTTSATTSAVTTSTAETVADSTGTIHEESLDGVPLVEGRGMRPDVDLYAAPPGESPPPFDVADILGRSSPPAPESALDFGQPS